MLQCFLMPLWNKHKYFLFFWFLAAASKHPCFLFPSCPVMEANVLRSGGMPFGVQVVPFFWVYKGNKKEFSSETLLLLQMQNQKLNSSVERVLCQEGRPCMTFKWNCNSVLHWAHLEWELHVLAFALLRNAYDKRTCCLFSFHGT